MHPIEDESHSWDGNIRDRGLRNTHLKGLTFTNSHKKIKWTAPRYGIFEDLDGSLTNTPGAMVATYYDHLLTDECTD